VINLSISLESLHTRFPLSKDSLSRSFRVLFFTVVQNQLPPSHWFSLSVYFFGPGIGPGLQFPRRRSCSGIIRRPCRGGLSQILLTSFFPSFPLGVFPATSAKDHFDLDFISSTSAAPPPAIPSPFFEFSHRERPLGQACFPAPLEEVCVSPPPFLG